jgi:hypothetical protein
VSTNPNAIVAPEFAQIPQSLNVTRDSLGRLLPGSVANPGGKPKSKLLRRRLMRQLLSEDGNVQQVDRVCSALIETGKLIGRNGVAAFEAIRDTVDGKPSADNVDAGGAQVVVNLVSFSQDADE